MFPQQQTTGQVQGSHYLGFGSFIQTTTGPIVNAIEGTILQTVGIRSQALVGTVETPGSIIIGSISQIVGLRSQAMVGSVFVNITGSISQTVGGTTQSMVGSINAQVSDLVGIITQTVGGLSQGMVATLTPIPNLPIAYSDRVLPIYAANLPKVTTGDSLNINHVITNRGKRRSIPLTAVIVSRLISIDRLVNYTPEVVQLSTQGQANWDKGIININMTEVVTEAIKTFSPNWIRGKCVAVIETQVYTDTKVSYFAEIELQIGTIT